MWTVFGWLLIIEKKWLMQAKDLGNKLATSAYRWNLWWCLANLIDSYAKSFVLPKCQPGPWMWMRTSYGNGNRATKRGWEEDKEMKMEMQMSTKAPDGEADPHKYTQLTMIIKCYAKNLPKLCGYSRRRGRVRRRISSSSNEKTMRTNRWQKFIVAKELKRRVETRGCQLDSRCPSLSLLLLLLLFDVHTEITKTQWRRKEQNRFKSRARRILAASLHTRDCALFPHFLLSQQLKLKLKLSGLQSSRVPAEISQPCGFRRRRRRCYPYDKKLN